MTTPIPDTLTYFATSAPDKLALVDDQRAGPLRLWTFAELETWANRVAGAIAALGVEAGDTLVWCGPNSPEVVAIIHACRKLAATAVPLNYRLTCEEAAYVIDNSDARVVWVDAEFVELVTGAWERLEKLDHVVVFGGAGPTGTRSADDLQLAVAEGWVPPPPGAPAATMIYTSGTTGHPKGAVRSTTNGSEASRDLIAHMGYRSDDVYLTTGPVYHSGPGGFMSLAQNLGMTVVLQRRFDAEDWLRLVERWRVTTTFTAPTPIRIVCNLAPDIKARYDLSSMRIMVANAAPWSMALKRAYLADFPSESLWEIYGSTELSVNTVLGPADQLRKPGSCGLPAPGVEIKLLGVDGDEVTEPDVPGELYVRSANVFETYHKAADRYDEDRQGDFHTVGDIAYRDEEGYLYICDRKKDMIISGGMNIYPAEVEAALEMHPNIYDVAVFGIPDEQWGEQVHAVVVARPPGSLTEAEVGEQARAHLAGYKVPRSVTFSDELPRTGSGKILKRVLREPFWRDYRTSVS